MSVDSDLQVVEPDNGSDYSDAFYARLYGTLVSVGLNEQRLIWMRYAGFLVLQGFIITAIARDPVRPALSLALSTAGIATCVVWHVLNFTGWLNQNIWFTMAARLSFSKLTVELPTDWWRQRRALRPIGKIYSIAQTVTIAFLGVYGVCLVSALLELGFRLELAGMLAAGTVVVGWVVFYFVERAEYDDRRKREDERPVA